MLRGLKIASLSFLLASSALAAPKTIEIDTGLPVVGTGGQIGIGITQILNKVQSEREYKYSVIAGAQGDTAALRAIELNKNNQDAILFTGVSTITFNRLTNAPVFDRDNDYNLSIGLGKNTIGILVSQDSPIKTLDDLVKSIKSKEITYFAGGISAPVSGLMNDIFIKHYGLEGKVKVLNYKTVPEIQLAINNHEADYTAFTLPDMTSLNALVVSSDERMVTFPNAPTAKELGIEDFSHQTILLYAVPKGKEQLQKQFEADMRLACKDPDFETVSKLRAPYNTYCMEPEDTIKNVKREMDLINKVYGH